MAYNCKLCGVSCTNAKGFQQHVNGKRHKRNLKRSEGGNRGGNNSVKALGAVGSGRSTNTSVGTSPYRRGGAVAVTGGDDNAWLKAHGNSSFNFLCATAGSSSNQNQSRATATAAAAARKQPPSGSYQPNGNPSKAKVHSGDAATSNKPAAATAYKNSCQQPKSEPEVKRGSLEIIIKCLYTGHQFSLYMEPTDTIGAVKIKAQDKDGMPPCTRHLALPPGFGQKYLRDGCTLSDCNFGYGAACLIACPRRVEVEATKPGFYKYIGGYISLPDDVTHVRVHGDLRFDAFRGNKNLTHVELCDGIKYYGKNAFSGCTSLKSVDICEGVEAIGQDMFRGCISLKSIKLPSSINTILWSAFQDCEGLVEVQVYDGISFIGCCAFLNCSALRRIKVLFREERHLETKAASDDYEFELWPELEHVGDRAFEGCISLKRIKIPPTLDGGERAPEGCVYPKRIDIASGAFSDFEEIELMEGIEELPDGVFRDDYLKRINIPSTVKSIPKEAFMNCEELTHVELSKGLESISAEAFRNCSSLHHIRIPSSCTIIMHGAFDTSALRTVELKTGLRQFDTRSFFCCNSLERIKIPRSVHTLHEEAFANCEHLSVVEFIEGELNSIREKSFSGCTSLRSVHFSSTLEVILEQAFNHCIQLMTIVLPENLQSIGCNTFPSCYSLRNIAIPPNSSIDTKCFEGCLDLHRLFGADDSEIATTLKTRFTDLPVHKMCFYLSNNLEDSGNTCRTIDDPYVSCDGNSENTQEVKRAIALDTTGKRQDCLGMTPLHILVCSAVQHIGLYKLIVDKYPKDLMTKDKWGDLPILYAIRSCVPENIILYLIGRMKAVYPTFKMDWDQSFASLCRSQPPTDTILSLIQMQQTSFSHDDVNWQNIAREVTIHCLLACGDDLTQIASIWEAVVTSLTEAQVPQELLQHVRDIYQTLLSGESTNWRTVCEEFSSLNGWPRREGGIFHSNKVFRILVKCSFPGRVELIGVRQWRVDIMNEVLTTPDDFNVMHSKLVRYEKKYEDLVEAVALLELAVWKTKMIRQPKTPGEHCQKKLKVDDHVARTDCRVNCGLDIILPNVLSFLHYEKSEVLS